MDIKFRSLSEAERLVDEIGEQIDDIAKLLDLQKQTLSASLNKFHLLAESFKLSFTDDPTPVSELDLNQGQKIKIPGGIKALAQNYKLLEELVEQEDTLTNAETAIKLTFKNDDRSQPLLTNIKRLLLKVEKQKNDVLVFLNNLATSSVPPTFNKYVFSVAQSVCKHISLTEEQYDVYYYLSTTDSCLLYSAFIELRGVENGEGDIVPKIYIGVHWNTGSRDVQSDVRLSLGYRWEPPRILYEESRLVSSSVAEAVAIADRMLDAEDFVVDIGVQPLSDRLRPGVKLNQIDLNALSLANKIKKLEVEPDEIIVHLVKVDKSQLSNVQAQVYLGIQKLFDRKTKLRMTISPNGLTLTFNIANFSVPKKFSSSEVEFFKSWGLTVNQIKKIELILGG